MRYSRDGTERSDRVGRAVAALLLIIGVVSLTAAWQLHNRTAAQLAAVRGDNPADLVYVPDAVTDAPVAGAATSAPARALTPTHLYVPAIGVDTTVRAKPTQHTADPFLHRTVDSFGVPDDMYTTTWWSSGPKPGSGAMAVVLGHTQINGYGVFNRLGRLHAGEPITVTGSSTPLRFRVILVRTGISKTDPFALRTALNRHPADAALALLTCSGTFNTSYDQSTQNTVVFARLEPASGS